MTRLQRLGSHSLSALTGMAILAAGCSGGNERRADDITAADSAGLRVVTIAGDLRGLPALRVADSIRLRGAPEDFFNGNPAKAFPLRDGRLLLSDGRNTGVFGVDGAFAGQFSRQGQGPGEIGFLSRLWQTTGDSLWTFDGSNRRLSLFGPTLAFARSVQQPTTSIERGLGIWGGLQGDTTAMLSFAVDNPAPSTQTRTTRVSFGLWVIGGEPVVGEERPWAQVVTPPDPAGGGFAMLMQPPFGRQAEWLPLGRCMTYGYSDRWRFALQAPDDSLRLRDVALLRGRGDAEAVTPERREAYITGMLAGMVVQERPMLERLYRDQIAFPDSTPHFSRVFASRDGALWIQRFRGTTTDEPDHWTVVDLATPRAWRLEVPAGSRVLAVDSARALIATKDSDDLETQVWWALPDLAGIQPPQGCRP